MSWLDQIKTGISITTGDGKVYTPDYIVTTSNKAQEFNISTFEFPNISGTLVKRYMPKGRRYNIEIHFQGPDCIDKAKEFDNSAADSRPWVIAHPYYGSLKVQPFSLSFDDSKLNDSIVTCPVMETIEEDGAQSTVSPTDKIIADKESTDAALADTYAEQVTPSVADKQDMETNTSSIYNEGKKIAKDETDSETYLNAFNTANSYITNATTAPKAAINKIQNMITAPARFKDSVQNRISSLTNQFNGLRNTVQGITTRAAKKLFENNAGTIISSMTLATVTGIDNNDYSNRTKVVNIIETLLTNYNNYITDLDTLQSANGGDIDSYIPDPLAVQRLGRLVSFAVSNLFSIAQKSKQQRTVYLDAASNWISLAHKYYGLLPDDSTITQIMEDNEAGINECLHVARERKIIYYV